MGFMKELAPLGGISLASKLFGSKKKPTPPLQPTMISTTPYERPISMIGRERG